MDNHHAARNQPESINLGQYRFPPAEVSGWGMGWTVVAAAEAMGVVQGHTRLDGPGGGTREGRIGFLDRSSRPA
jgi:hypothetical protein